MRKTLFTVVAVCARLLWVGAVYAAPGGLPACQASLKLETTKYNTCESNLTTAQLCGNYVIDPGEQCDQSNLNGKTCVTQRFVGGTLQCGANCVFETSGCFTQAQRFIDNGDGTVTDYQTGLMWEKQTGTVGTFLQIPPVTDVNNRYTWSAGDNLADGQAFTSFLATLNNGGSTDGGATTAITGCFANHCDWRLPSIVELRGIIDASAIGCGSGSPCIDPIFGPTQSSFIYWSATTLAGDPNYAWGVIFFDGTVILKAKGDGYYVRAVRSGL